MPDPSPFVSTFLGHRFELLAPAAIAIEDIAHGLAFQCRFNGQTTQFYSVAQHSLLVASLLPKRLALTGLLHDAAEAYVGDLVKPLKSLLPAFAQIEARVLTAIGARFGVAGFDERAVKRADLVALATEKRDLMPRSGEAWPSLEGIAPLPARIEPLAPAQARAQFLAAFARLSANQPGRIAA